MVQRRGAPTIQKSANLKSVKEEFSGVLAIPQSGSGPGLLLIHAWWGLNDFFKSLTTRFGEAGFVTLAPDYYNGQVADTVERARALRAKTDAKNTEKLLSKAVDLLKTHPAVHVKQIGLVGFSLGARLALDLARTKAEYIGAVVVFYGVAGGNFAKCKIPVQGHFAEKDDWGAGPEAVRKLRDRLVLGSGKVEFNTYPGTTHWFFEENVTNAYNAQAAQLAFSRAVTFLRQWLGK